MKKRHQHFIPRTYLKHFKNSPDSEHVNTFNKIDHKFIDNIGLNDICVEKDFYTLKNLDGEDKLALEEFFDKEIESKYSKVFNLLVNQRPSKITLEQKIDILKTTLSMYFRTPKILNQFLLKIDKLIEDLTNNNDINEIEFKGIIIKLSGKKKDEIKKEIREHLRIDYLSIQLNIFEEFVKYKLYDGITVIENTSEFDFYTGDNPVNFLNRFGNTDQIFDINNSIYIPLNPKFCLLIAAPKLPKSGYEIFYQKDNQMLIHVVNSCTFDNSERWIIGQGEDFKVALLKNIELNSTYDLEHPMLKSLEIKTILLANLLQAIEKGGLTNKNDNLLLALNNIKNWDEHKNHHDLVELLETMRVEDGLHI
ncbi:hypothetical protein AR438_07740 [Chryseobacterium aquaticum]|uniref:DUF4238 domain-containing protein n=1 Tax=Chryseobacterium aquaticum TaxID=452084 RepID=A0A0Q3P778_9FLAO|nr:DUF4238 domain-containing protein [Chryseobacterium aquaticum]KQK25494.1 hypothetical protein AR438_07740 [Chryseobacterium aquaticum]